MRGDGDGECLRVSGEWLRVSGECLCVSGDKTVSGSKAESFGVKIFGAVDIWYAFTHLMVLMWLLYDNDTLVST